MNRSSLYGRAQILQGDKTSHGGVVIGGNPTHTFYDIPIARKGDKVTCPRCKPHIFEIAEGEENCTDTAAELPMAAEGHRTTCGAILIAESAGKEAIAAAMQMAEDATSGKQYAYDEQYVIRDEDGNPVEGIYYTIKTDSGKEVHGVTNEHGETYRVGTDKPEKLELILGGNYGDHE